MKQVVYESEVFCVICEERVWRFASWDLPKVGEPIPNYCWSDGSTESAVIDSVEKIKEISHQEEISRWRENAFVSVDTTQAMEAFSPDRKAEIEKVVKLRVWIYPVGSLSKRREEEAEKRKMWELEKVEALQDPELGRFLFHFKWKGNGSMPKSFCQVRADGEHEAWTKLNK